MITSLSSISDFCSSYSILTSQEPDPEGEGQQLTVCDGGEGGGVSTFLLTLFPLPIHELLT